MWIGFGVEGGLEESAVSCHHGCHTGAVRVCRVLVRFNHYVVFDTMVFFPDEYMRIHSRPRLNPRPSSTSTV